MDTLLVVLYGGPGTGKSTTAALVFGALKQAGYNVEVAHEYAKDLTWEERHAALGYQPYIAAKQMWREQRLMGQVDAIITDTSTLLGLVYQGKGYTEALAAWLKDEYARKNTLDFYLHRDPTRPYNVRGRTQDATAATRLDGKIRYMLLMNNVRTTDVMVDKDTNSHVDFIVKQVKEKLDAASR